jgi:hypothetical protein
MKKTTARKRNVLRREYELSKLKGGVQGKYYRRYSGGTKWCCWTPILRTCSRMRRR